MSITQKEILPRISEKDFLAGFLFKFVSNFSLFRTKIIQNREFRIT